MRFFYDVNVVSVIIIRGIRECMYDVITQAELKSFAEPAHSVICYIARQRYSVSYRVTLFFLRGSISDGRPPAFCHRKLQSNANE